MKLPHIILGITASALLIGWLEMDYFNAAGQEGHGTKALNPQKGVEHGEIQQSVESRPVLAAPPPQFGRLGIYTLQDWYKYCFERGKQYAVLNYDGTIRCAQLVPGWVWNPYTSAEEENAIRSDALKRLARKK